MNIQHIPIETESRIDRLLPFFSPSGTTPREIEVAASMAYADFMLALGRVREIAKKANEYMQHAPKIDLGPLDDISAMFSDWIDDVEARADMIQESLEYDR